MFEYLLPTLLARLDSRQNLVRNQNLRHDHGPTRLGPLTLVQAAMPYVFSVAGVCDTLRSCAPGPASSGTGLTFGFEPPLPFVS